MSESLYTKDFDDFDNKTTEQKLEEIADREEIRELVARYALGIARGAPVYELFTEDAFRPARRSPGCGGAYPRAVRRGWRSGSARVSPYRS